MKFLTSYVIDISSGKNLKMANGCHVFLHKSQRVLGIMAYHGHVMLFIEGLLNMDRNAVSRRVEKKSR